MKNDHIYKLFARDAEMSEVINFGVDYGMVNRHPLFKLEHLIYGFMCYFKMNSRNYGDEPVPLCVSYQYTKISSLSRTPSVESSKEYVEMQIHVDVDTLNRFFWQNEKLLDDLYPTPVMVYYMILFLLSLGVFETTPFIPNQKKCYSLPKYKSFKEILLKSGWLESQNISSYLKNNQICFSDLDFIEKEIIYSTEVSVKYTTDLTYKAYLNQLDSITGRERETARLINIINKMRINNVVLIGMPGVGKTAIVHGLCQKLINNDVPDSLKEYHVIEFNYAEAISGSKYRGDFEERINILFKTLERIVHQGTKIILFFDEIHEIVNLGDSNEGGAMSLSSMLKPVLLNPSIKIVGTSTFTDYKKLEKDSALERRFDTIVVDEPDFEQTFLILYNMKGIFEKKFDLRISNSTLKSCIELSQQYITDRYLPAKAINCLDEACSIKQSSNSHSNILSSSDIASCISMQKGIPIEKIHSITNFNGVEKDLKSMVIGQNHAITSIVKALKRSSVGLNDESRPIASFLFVGPTGVGKTQIAKSLADSVFSGKENIVRFDMSEYMEEHSVSKLIGSPPGYTGHEEGGLLTEKVRRHPYSLILFDEIEKAHPKVYNILLQILDEGNLTDSCGDTINFKNTIIILTSNVGANDISKPPMGFNDNSSTKQRDIAISAVKRNFTPEFLNRLDEIVVFNNLSKNNIIQITELCIRNEIISKLSSRNISVSVADDVIRFIAKIGYSTEYGARELKRTITDMLKNPIADYLIENDDVKSIYVTLSDDKVKISSKKAVCV